MHRGGHIGVTLAVYAPVAYMLVNAGEAALALLGLVGMVVIEPLPDRDMEIPILNHRGGSHTLLCAALVGLCVGTFVLVGGRELRGLLVSQLTGTFLSHTASDVAAMDIWALAIFASSIAAFAIVSHLLGDVLTPMGIRPFWPVSSRTISFDLWTASNRIANPLLFVLGIGALASAVWVGAGLPVPSNVTAESVLREVLRNL